MVGPAFFFVGEDDFVRFRTVESLVVAPIGCQRRPGDFVRGPGRDLGVDDGPRVVLVRAPLLDGVALVVAGVALRLRVAVVRVAVVRTRGRAVVVAGVAHLITVRSTGTVFHTAASVDVTVAVVWVALDCACVWALVVAGVVDRPTLAVVRVAVVRAVFSLLARNGVDATRRIFLPPFAGIHQALVEFGGVRPVDARHASVLFCWPEEEEQQGDNRDGCCDASTDSEDRGPVGRRLGGRIGIFVDGLEPPRSGARWSDIRVLLFRIHRIVFRRTALETCSIRPALVRPAVFAGPVGASVERAPQPFVFDLRTCQVRWQHVGFLFVTTFLWVSAVGANRVTTLVVGPARTAGPVHLDFDPTTYVGHPSPRVV